MNVRVGALLRASTGTWEHRAPSGYSYQWQQGNAYGKISTFTNVTEISGSTGKVAEYRVRAGDENHTLRCAVTATNVFGAKAEYTPFFIVGDNREPEGLGKTFGYGLGGITGRECVLAAYPATVKGSPCVIFTHEGAFTEQGVAEEPEPGESTVEPGAPELVKSMGCRAPSNTMQGRGWAVFNVNWRQDDATHTPGYPLEIPDIIRAIQWVQANAELFNGDPGNICMIGGSAGGSLAMMTATKLNEFKPGYIKGVAALSGISSVSERVFSSLKAIEEAEAKAYGTLKKSLVSGTEYSEFEVNPLALEMPNGTEFKIWDGEGHKQNWKTTATAAKEASIVKVKTVSGASKANFSYPANTTKLNGIDLEDQRHINHMAYFSGENSDLLETPGWLATRPNIISFLESISPVGHVSPNMPPIHYYISAKDKVPRAQGEHFLAVVAAAGLEGRVTLFEPPGGHAFAFWGTTMPSGESVSEEINKFLKSVVT